MPLFLLSLSLLLAVSATRADHPDSSGRRMVTLSGDVAFLREPAAIVAGTGGALVVKTLLPADRRTPSARGIDLREGDTVVMANGKRVRTVVELRDLYASLPPGAECKLAIRRGPEMRMAAFAIASPDEGSPTQLRIIRGGSDSAGVFPALGVALVSHGGRVTVEQRIAGGKAALQPHDVAPGDQVVRLNGLAVASVKAFARAFDALAVGAELRLVIARGNTEHTVVIRKPQPAGPIVIKRQGP